MGRSIATMTWVRTSKEDLVCRSIKTLRTEPQYTEDDVRSATLQYVRKLSGYRTPSRRNEEAFNDAVQEVSDATKRLLQKI